MTPPEPDARLTPAHWLLLLILAAVQLAHTVDFMLIMPLAPSLKTALDIDAQSFAWVVSAYGAAAFVSGLVVAPWLDRFDRKRSLLALLVGFTLGTLLCAVARSFEVLLAGRAIAGAFGGIAGANVLAIVGDAFPDRRRGMATGVVMSAFSVANIVGVPAGLFLAGIDPADWWKPFAWLAAGSAGVLLMAVFVIPPQRHHLDKFALPMTMLAVVTRPAHLRAFAVMLTIVFGSFFVFPFLPDYLVRNVGVPFGQVFWVYLLGGAATLFSMNLVGRLADRYPRLLLFRVINVAGMGAVLLVTHLPEGTPVPVVLLTTTLLMILMSGRMVPLTALTTGLAPPSQRGTFLSVMASVQMLGLALGPVAAGLLMRNTGGNEPLEGFGNAGIASAAVGLVAVLMVGLLKPPRPVTPVSPADPAPASSPAAAGISPAPGVHGRA